MVFDSCSQHFYLLSLHCSRKFIFDSDDGVLEEEISRFFENLNVVCGGNIYAEYSFEDSMLQSAYDLSERLKIRYPSIQQLPAFFKTLKVGDYFIRHHAAAPILDLKRSLVKIEAYANGSDMRICDTSFVQSCGILYLKYDTYSYGYLSNKIRIGEPDKGKRKCRFCGNTGKEFFKEEAHAILESLGNKRIFCNEECDKCNQLFERDVESHLFKFCEIQRTLAKVSGKYSQVHHLEGRNFHIHPDPNNAIPIVYVMNEGIINDLYNGKSTGRINLYNNGTISFQGLYKALVKIAIDVIPSDKISFFSDIAHWVHGDIEITALPPFLYGEHDAFLEHPIIDVFFRREDSPSFSPFCTAVLYVFSSIFMFTIPQDDITEDRFVTLESLSKHFDLFKRMQYFNVPEWEAMNSNDKSMLSPCYKIPIISQNDSYRIVFKPHNDNVFKIRRVGKS